MSLFRGTRSKGRGDVMGATGNDDEQRYPMVGASFCVASELFYTLVDHYMYCLSILQG
jgi:hypothetical protein